MLRDLALYALATLAVCLAKVVIYRACHWLAARLCPAQERVWTVKVGAYTVTVKLDRKENP